MTFPNPQLLTIARGTVGPVVTALLATAAAVTRNPELVALSVPTGALADAMTEQGVLLVTRTLQNPAELVQDFADAVAEDTGQPVEQFIGENVTTPSQRDFLGRTVENVAVARSDWRVRVLARAFVHGVHDGDLIDETEMFVQVTRDMEPGHARLLAAIDKATKRTTGRFATYADIEANDKRIGPALPLLRRALIDQGFVEAQKSSPVVQRREGSRRPAPDRVGQSHQRMADWHRH